MYLLITIFILCLAKLALIDLKTGNLPDCYTLPLLWLGLLGQSFLPWLSLQNAVWGATCGYGILWLIYWIFKLCFHKEGMGYGDFKLLAALGAWLGWAWLPFVLLIASLTTLGVIFFLRMIKRQALPAEIPFGPGLALGGVAVLLKQVLTFI